MILREEIRNTSFPHRLPSLGKRRHLRRLHNTQTAARDECASLKFYRGFN